MSVTYIELFFIGTNINFCNSGGKLSGGVNKEGINF